VEETMEGQIAHKERREMWKGGSVSSKAVEVILDKGLRVIIGGGDGMKRL
jgi:diacylglycerol kinase family enzyme